VRIPLQTKKTKRCGVCKHILIKPEQKAQSVRYKIKLVAANYLPAITLSLPQHRPPPGVARAGAAPPPLLGLQAGKTHAFQLAFTNPLYDPIQVRLTRHVSIGDDQDKARRPPFAITLPNIPFPVAAFAEAWEYDEDDEMDEAEDLVGLRGDVAGGKTVGVLEKKANVTIIGGEVMLGKSAKGDVKV
jgi:dynactin-4